MTIFDLDRCLLTIQMIINSSARDEVSEQKYILLTQTPDYNDQFRFSHFRFAVQTSVQSLGENGITWKNPSRY